MTVELKTEEVRHVELTASTTKDYITNSLKLESRDGKTVTVTAHRHESSYDGFSDSATVYLPKGEIIEFARSILKAFGE